MSVFGFSTEPAPGDFLPIIKYDARAGRIFRIDRTQAGPTPIDITDQFCAIFDLEHVETGWINFSGPIPDFKLVPLNPTGETTLPVKPSENHKNGIRIMLKLHPACAGADKPVREFSTSAKAALSGLQKLYLDYQQQRQLNKLPIVGMRGAVPVKTGSGERQSTNYVPQFTILGWADRPSDLVYIARGSSGPSQNALPLTPAQPAQQYAPKPNGPPGNGGWPAPNQGPPLTGSTQVPAPGWPSVQQLAQQAQPAAPSLSDDFG